MLESSQDAPPLDAFPSIRETQIAWLLAIEYADTLASHLQPSGFVPYSMRTLAHEVAGHVGIEKIIGARAQAEDALPFGRSDKTDIAGVTTEVGDGKVSVVDTGHCDLVRFWTLS